MGVSIGWQPIEPTTRWITPGWRSMMHQLLLDNNLYGQLDKSDIPTLLEVGRKQMRGVKDPPFDHADDIQKAFQSLVRAIRKHGSIVVIFEF
jgi:hypothetical protein